MHRVWQALRWVGSIGIVAAVTACSGGSSEQAGSYGTGDPRLAAANPGGGAIDPFLADGHAVVKALDTIAAHSGTPLRVTSMNADTINGLTVDVVQPKNHTNVDRYLIAPDGTLTGPKPVQLMSMGGGPITAASVDRQAFDPKAIQFARLKQTVHDAIAKSHFSDARVANREIDGVGPDDKRYIYLQAARGRPVATVRPDLTIVGVQF